MTAVYDSSPASPTAQAANSLAAAQAATKPNIAFAGVRSATARGETVFAETATAWVKSAIGEAAPFWGQ